MSIGKLTSLRRGPFEQSSILPGGGNPASPGRRHRNRGRQFRILPHRSQRRCNGPICADRNLALPTALARGKRRSRGIHVSRVAVRSPAAAGILAFAATRAIARILSKGQKRKRLGEQKCHQRNRKPACRAPGHYAQYTPEWGKNFHHSAMQGRKLRLQPKDSKALRR